MECSLPLSGSGDFAFGLSTTSGQNHSERGRNAGNEQSLVVWYGLDRDGRKGLQAFASNPPQKGAAVLAIFQRRKLVQQRRFLIGTDYPF